MRTAAGRRLHTDAQQEPVRRATDRPPSAETGVEVGGSIPPPPDYQAPAQTSHGRQPAEDSTPRATGTVSREVTVSKSDGLEIV